MGIAPLVTFRFQWGYFSFQGFLIGYCSYFFISVCFCLIISSWNGRCAFISEHFQHPILKSLYTLSQISSGNLRKFLIWWLISKAISLSPSRFFHMFWNYSLSKRIFVFVWFLSFSDFMKLNPSGVESKYNEIKAATHPMETLA